MGAVDKRVRWIWEIVGLGFVVPIFESKVDSRMGARIFLMCDRPKGEDKNRAGICGSHPFAKGAKGWGTPRWCWGRAKDCPSPYP